METLTQIEKYLIFDVNEVKLGIEISRVKEVFKTNKIFTLPRTSPIIAGIVNLRGSIITIFNMVELLFNSSKEKFSDFSNKESNIILVNINNQDVGLLVDQVVHLTGIEEHQDVDLKKLKQLDFRLSPAISKVGVASDSFTYLLDIDKMMSEYLSLSDISFQASEEDEFDDFDYEQYTLPDPQEAEKATPVDDSKKKTIKTTPLKEAVEDEFDDFDYDQYTLPDPEQKEEKVTPEKPPSEESKVEAKSEEKEESEDKS